MSRELTTRSTHALTVPADLEAVRGYVDASLSANTRRAYRAGLAAFQAWCKSERVKALPASPESVALFLAMGAHEDLSVSTLEQRLAAIRWAHEAAGQESPTASKLVRSTMQGIRREQGAAPNRKAPATVDRLAAMVSHADPATRKGLRDRALLLFGFASAMRRSELVALTVEDLEETKRGLLVTLRRSKTDQEGHGQQRAIPRGRNPETCPVRALDAWLKAARISEGRIFRSVTRHSQRAGFVTSAAEKGRSTERIMDHTGHRSAAMVRVYTRRVDAFTDHAGEGLL